MQRKEIEEHGVGIQFEDKTKRKLITSIQNISRKPTRSESTVR